MGLGGESDREWQERASRAATERLAHLTAHLTEASGTLRREMEATEAVLGQTQTELARERAVSEAANKLVLTALQIPQIEGVTEDGTSLSEILKSNEVTAVDIVGLATDYCVLASAKDAVAQHLDVRVLTDLVAGVAPETSAAALDELREVGAAVV